jgi:hypothetical protein
MEKSDAQPAASKGLAVSAFIRVIRGLHLHSRSE